MATDRCGKFIATHVWVLTVCVHASHPLLERHKQHIAIRDLEPMVLHGIAAYCNGIFYRIFVHVIICAFSLHTSVNCMKNVMELLAHTQTRYQVLLSDFFERLGTRLEYVCSMCEFINCFLCSPTTPSCTMCGRWGVCVCVCVCVCVRARVWVTVSVPIRAEQVGNFPCQLIG